MSDDRLRRMLEAGDFRGAFQLLYSAHRREVAKFVRARVGSSSQADDVCQEVWSAVNVGLPRFRFESQPRVWILSIARYKSQDVWRKHKSSDPLDSQIVAGGALASALGIRRAESPTTLVRRKERSAGLRQALSDLRPDEREMLELRFVMGMKPAEIAQVLGSDLSANAVSQRIVRILRRVRDRMDED